MRSCFLEWSKATYGLSLNQLFGCRLKYVFIAGEHCDEETRHWTTNAFGVPVLDNWWQTGNLKCPLHIEEGPFGLL